GSPTANSPQSLRVLHSVPAVPVSVGRPPVSERRYEGGNLHLTDQNHAAKGAPIMDRHATRSVDIPKWSALLVEAVNKPGLIMEAYRAFHNYSIGNQILALVQCQFRGLEPGPINTFPRWQALGRTVKRGQRALILCTPITPTVRHAPRNHPHQTEVPHP